MSSSSCSDEVSAIVVCRIGVLFIDEDVFRLILCALWNSRILPRKRWVLSSNTQVYTKLIFKAGLTLPISVIQVETRTFGCDSNTK